LTEVVVHHLLEAYCDGQTLYAAYKKLEQCPQQGNEKVFKFKIHLEELFWTLEDEPSELAKTEKFMSSLLPSLNRKLLGKEYSSFAHAVEAAQVEEWLLGEAERRTHGEDWEQHRRGRGAESDHVQGGKQERSKPKSKSREALEKSQSQRFNEIKVAGSAARRATFQLSAQSREGRLSLFGQR